MLIAVEQNGKPFSLLKAEDRAGLQELRQTRDFFCPVCGDRLLMKLGDKKCFHFSHFRNSICSNMSEPETPDHIQGKKDLYNWLARQGYAPQVEWVLSSISQRADLGLDRFPRPIAFEFQCSTLPQERLIQRDRGYLSQSIDPIWIWHDSRLKRLGPNMCHITSLELSTRRFPFRQSPNSRIERQKGFLTFYHPHSKHLTFLYNFLPLSSRKIWCERRSQPLNQLSLQDLLTPRFSLKPSTSWSTLWLQQKKKWRLRVATRAHHFERDLHRLAESKNVIWNAFPGYVGCPLGDDTVIETASHLWQGWICLEFLVGQGVGTCIPYSEIEKGLIVLINRKSIVLPAEDSILEDDWRRVVKAYLTALCTLGFLQAIDGRSYRIIRDLSWSEPFLDQLLKEDQQMLLKWNQKVKG